MSTTKYFLSTKFQPDIRKANAQIESEIDKVKLQLIKEKQRALRDTGTLLERPKPMASPNAKENFRAMPITELLAHEKGILNLLEAESVEQVTQDDYNSIFNDTTTSFYEKKAFVDLFRRKWREDKGLCSLFDKRQMYKQAMQDAKQKQRLSPTMKSLLVNKNKEPTNPFARTSEGWIMPQTPENAEFSKVREKNIRQNYGH